MDQPYHQMENSYTVGTCHLCKCSFQILPGTFSVDVRRFPSTAKGKRYKLVQICKCPNPSCPSSITKIIKDLTDTTPISKKLSQLVTEANGKITKKCPLVSPLRDTIGYDVTCRCGYEGTPKLSAIYQSPVSSGQDPFAWKTICPKCSSIMMVGSAESISFDCHPR